MSVTLRFVRREASSPGPSDTTPPAWLQEVEGGPVTGRLAEDLVRENDRVKSRIGDAEVGMLCPYRLFWTNLKTEFKLTHKAYSP